jgi:hypothetical protein
MLFFAIIGVAVLVLCLVHSARAGLIGHWKLDETTGTKALDNSGHSGSTAAVSMVSGRLYIDDIYLTRP